MHCMHCGRLAQRPDTSRHSIERQDSLRCSPVCVGDPVPETRFEAGDVVVVLGEPDGLAAAEMRLLQGGEIGGAEHLTAILRFNSL